MSRVLALLLACLLAAPPAAAETLRSERDGLVSALVLSDDLAAHPEFAGFLRGEALAIRDNYARRAPAAARLELTDRATFVSAEYASVRRDILRRTAKEDIVTVEALTWDARARNFARLDAWFDAGAPLDEALGAISFRLRKGVQDRLFAGSLPPDWRVPLIAATAPDTAVLSNFTLAASDASGRAAGLSFHFNPREVAPGDDPVTLTLPWRVFAAWLNPRGRALFGGELSP